MFYIHSAYYTKRKSILFHQRGQKTIQFPFKKPIEMEGESRMSKHQVFLREYSIFPRRKMVNNPVARTKRNSMLFHQKGQKTIHLRLENQKK